MINILEKAGLTREILKDPKLRVKRIDEYNASVGGLRELMSGGKLEIAHTNEIPAKVNQADVIRYIRFVASGKRVPIVFAAGRATRLKLPRSFDALGIAGLTPNILKELNSLREGEEAPNSKIEASAKLRDYLEFGRNGELDSPDDLSFIQRHILRLRQQMEELIQNHPASGVALQDWLDRAKFAVVANEENKTAIALQLAAVNFAGLKPEHVYIVVQPEEGGMEVLPDGSTVVYDKQAWPEGHGKPFIDMQADANAAFCLNAKGHLVSIHKTFTQELTDKGVERAVFAQVNDLHLLEDMLHVQRWVLADQLIKSGAEMVMEMVENGLKQKGGGIFVAKNGSVVMRDTICMKSPDLEVYAVPQSLSRMFYELTVQGMSKLKPEVLPAYLNERKTHDNKTVLTREYYSGDASSILSARAIQMNGYELNTFKMQGRIPEALAILSKFKPN